MEIAFEMECRFSLENVRTQPAALSLRMTWWRSLANLRLDPTQNPTHTV